MPVSPDLVRLAESLEGKVAAEFMAAVERLSKAVSAPELIRALQSGSVQSVLSALKTATIPAQLAKTARAATRILEVAGNEAMRALLHGTPQSGLKVLEVNQNGVVFATPARWAAEFHATKAGGVGAIHEFSTEVKAPRIVSTMAFDDLTADKEFIRETKRAGYDAIVSDDGLSYALFEPILLTKGGYAFAPSFNINNPLASRAAEANGARLIRDLSDSTKAGIRALVSRSFVEGLPPRTIAKLIRDGDGFGLTERGAQAVVNARQAWERAGLTGEKLDAKVTAYSKKLLRKRSLNIARTESIAAVSEGQLAAWRVAADEGYLQKGRTRRTWIAGRTERTCPVCRSMNGQKVAFDDPFVDLNGRPHMAPPAHPSCRCTVALAFSNKQRRK